MTFTFGCQADYPGLSEFLNQKSDDASYEQEPEIGINGFEEDIQIMGNVEFEEKEHQLPLYFLQSEDRYLFPLTVIRTTSTPARDAVEILYQGVSQGVWGESPFPEGLALRDVTVLERKARVSLVYTAEVGNFYLEEKKLFLDSMILTLTSIPGIDDVELVLEEVDSPKVNLVIKDIYPSQEVILNPLEEIAPEDNKILLWFSDYNSMYMVPVTLKVETIPLGAANKALLLIEELIKGPGEKYNLQQSFPEGTEVISLKVRDGVAEVDFNSKLIDAHQGGSAGEWVTINSLVLTLTELPEIDKVQILVEGRREEAAFGHSDTAEPLKRGIVNRINY